MFEFSNRDIEFNVVNYQIPTVNTLIYKTSIHIFMIVFFNMQVVYLTCIVIMYLAVTNKLAVFFVVVAMTTDMNVMMSKFTIIERGETNLTT